MDTNCISLCVSRKLKRIMPSNKIHILSQAALLPKTILYRVFNFLDNQFRTPLEWILPILGLITLKILLLIAYNGTSIGTRFDFISDMMLSGSEWIRHVDPDDMNNHIVLEKMMGMPSLFFLTKYFFNFETEVLPNIFLSLLSSIAGYCLYYMMRTLRFGQRLAFLCCFVYLIHLPLFTDIFSMYTDGLYGPLFVISVTLLISSKENWTIFLCGIILSLACLSRSVLFYFIPFLFLASFYVNRDKTVSKRLISSALFIIPALSLGASYMVWNKIRTNHYFLTTSPATALSAVVFLIAEDAPLVFRETTQAGQTMKKIALTEQEPLPYSRSFINAGNLVRLLHDEYKMNVVEISKNVSREYIHVIMDNPIIFMGHVLRNIKKSIIFTSSFITLPIARWDDFSHVDGSWHHSNNKRADWFRFLATFDRSFLSYYSTAYGIIHTLSIRVFGYTAILLLSFFFLFHVFKFFSRNEKEFSRLYIILYLMLAYNIILHSLVSVEPRYFATTSFIPVVLLAIALKDMSIFLKRDSQ